MIDNSLPAFSQRFHSYKIKNIGQVSDYLVINVRLLFRSFKPNLLIIDHPELIDNLPIFEIDSIADTIYVKSSEWLLQIVTIKMMFFILRAPILLSIFQINFNG